MKSIRSATALQRLVLLILLPAFALLDSPIQANPSGGVVVHGAADIAQAAANHLKIHQHSQTAIINWQNFSIGAGEITQFVQPGGGTALNRVVGGNISQIHGALQANANVYVINPNGIFIGAQGVVDIGGHAVLSTLDISNEDFLSGSRRFQGDSRTGITNFGSIESAGGDVILLGGFVDNHGQIGALNGTVAIGSGGDIELMQTSSGRISIRGGSDYEGVGINNEGVVQGAAVEMKAHGNVYALAINNTGMVRASGATRENGRVRLRASGGSSNINLGQTSQITSQNAVGGGSIRVESTEGSVNVDGVVSASSSLVGGSVEIVGRDIVQEEGSTVGASGATGGGSVTLAADESLSVNGAVDVSSSAAGGGSADLMGRTIDVGSQASVAASGGTTGGSIRVGGDFQGAQVEGLRIADSVSVERGATFHADSALGDAGSVIVWAQEDTTFFADVSAAARGAIGNGGFVEISGREHLQFDGMVNASSLAGRSGTVLFDPGDVTIGGAGSTMTIESINNMLQGGTNVIVFTDSGNITIESLGGGGPVSNAATGNDRHGAIQWTNSNASFGAFASGSIFVNNHIRTSGGGSVNLLAGWAGSEGDVALSFDPQSAWDFYVSQGQFGKNGGGVFVGSATMERHVEVGSRFGDTSVAGFNIRVRGADANSNNRYAMIGFHDGGQVFAPTMNTTSSNNPLLDLTRDEADGIYAAGSWYLSDGLNTGGAAGELASGVHDPIVAVVGWFEVDINGDGIVDGVRGINSTGVLEDTFIPYANHYNSSLVGNWWWQQIEDAGSKGLSIAGVVQTADPLGLGGLRPEHGAGTADRGANINVVAAGNVSVEAGGRSRNPAMIGHGGINDIGSGVGRSTRSVGTSTPTSSSFSHADLQGGTRAQLERRWSVNGTNNDRNGTAIARLAPVYGNINVFAGVDTSRPVAINRAAGTVSATVAGQGSVVVRGDQDWTTSSSPSFAFAQIGHGGRGQFGEFNGDIHVEAGGSVFVQAGAATGAYAAIGHTINDLAYWDPPSNVDQQIRFFATAGDFDNPNLRRGELFTGQPGTPFDPFLDPLRHLRMTLDPDNTTTEDAPLLINETQWDLGGNYRLIEGTSEYRNIYTGQVIEFNPILYSRGSSDVNGNSSVGGQVQNALAPLVLSPASTAAVPITVETLDGSVLKGMHGDITVIAKNGDIQVHAGNSPDDVSLLTNTSASNRERRFASIGHGGTSDAQARSGLGSGYQNAVHGTPTTLTGSTSSGVPGTATGMEDVRLRFRTSSLTGDPERDSGSYSFEVLGGDTLSRAPTFMGMSGDVVVQAGRDVSVVAGNDIYDFAQVGHGGGQLADYETSSFVLGDISVVAGRNMVVQGGGEIPNEGRSGNSTTRAHAMVGHGGYLTGFMVYMGDIDVNVGGTLRVTGGAYSGSFGKIGHQGYRDYGQVGGDFFRDEHFGQMSLASATVSSSITQSGATVDYVFREREGTGDDIVMSDIGMSRTTTAGNLSPNGATNTANLTITVGGDLLVNHLADGRRVNWRGAQGTNNPDNPAGGIRTVTSYAQIGHGGTGTRPFAGVNPLSNYGNKIGDITIDVGGNIVLENAGPPTLIDIASIPDPPGWFIDSVTYSDASGNLLPEIVIRGGGTDRWTRIGHGVGAGSTTLTGSGDLDDRNRTGSTTTHSAAIELAGNITVSAGGDILVDANAADANENPFNTDAQRGAAPPSGRNPVVIGHGAAFDIADVVVLSNGELINGLAAQSNIRVTAGRDLTIRGGKGFEGSYAQIGHGTSSQQGNQPSRRLNVPTGYSGDIFVSVGNNLLIEAGQTAWVEMPAGSLQGIGRSIVGAYAAIGNGGYQMDRTPANGNITVYVGNDLTIKAQDRTQVKTRLPDASGSYVLINTDGDLTLPTDERAVDHVASLHNFAKIGHINAENGDRTSGLGDAIRNSSQSGNILVVVNRDLHMQGGNTPSMDFQPVYGSFAQIGHGGPGMGGDVGGDVTVLVGRDLTTVRGVNQEGSQQPNFNPNNYVMIGNGDWIFGATASPGALFRTGGEGLRYGDVTIAVGRHATFDRTLVGHADPAVTSRTILGDTQVAASRLNPFFGGGGLLTATNGSVFTSGLFGSGSRLEFYIPARSNNLIDGTTRINEASATFVTSPGNFAGPFNPDDEEEAGREDEVYLTPDLWWDNQGRAAAAKFPGGAGFPSNATSGMGGAIADVKAPGGLFNLVGLNPGVLGDSAPQYRGGNGVSGAGQYTFYFDAIRFVLNSFPVPPTPPGPPPPPPFVFDFAGFQNEGGGSASQQYEAFLLSQSMLMNESAGAASGLYGVLGQFELEEDSIENTGPWNLETRLDRAFGERRSSFSPEERAEEHDRRRRRARRGNPLPTSFYVYSPTTNQYSSFQVFGVPATNFLLTN